jgi:hypothetical protein
VRLPIRVTGVVGGHDVPPGGTWRHLDPSVTSWQASAAHLPCLAAWWAQVLGATPGPQMTGSQRTTTVSSGSATSQVTCHVRPGSAGRLHRPALPRTEELAGCPRGFAACQQGLGSPGTGLTHRPSWYRRRQAGAKVVLTSRATSVPFRARRHRFATVNNGHSRSSDLRDALLEVRGNTNGKDGVTPVRPVRELLPLRFAGHGAHLACGPLQVTTGCPRFRRPLGRPGNAGGSATGVPWPYGPQPRCRR